MPSGLLFFQPGIEYPDDFVKPLRIVSQYCGNSSQSRSLPQTLMKSRSGAIDKASMIDDHLDTRRQVRSIIRRFGSSFSWSSRCLKASSSKSFLMIQTAEVFLVKLGEEPLPNTTTSFCSTDSTNSFTFSEKLPTSNSIYRELNSVQLTQFRG